MEKTPQVRWKQRFQNFEKAYTQFYEGILLSKSRKLSVLEEQGLIQSFEYTFELAWKTLKDFLKQQEVDAKFPRETIQLSYQHELIHNGELWIDMLEKRKLMAHTYDESNANLALSLIINEYTHELKRFYEDFKRRE
jgi:nucleotidyltransferase substrate binding protein (TIGR01987 family)